jgi:predicted anti-sigma-YlaC factor YlaD
MATNTPPVRDRKLASTGARFLLAAVALAVVGVILVIVLGGLANGIGVVLLLFAGIAAVVGIALLGSSGISRWSRQGKPFA